VPSLKNKRSQIHNLTMHHRLLKKQERVKLKSGRWEEIIKIRAEIKEMKTKGQYKKVMKQKVISLKR
jgi:hypothetical protein